MTRHFRVQYEIDERKSLKNRFSIFLTSFFGCVFKIIKKKEVAQRRGFELPQNRIDFSHPGTSQ